MSKILKISKTAILKTLKFENQLNLNKNLAKIEKPPFLGTSKYENQKFKNQ